MPADHWKDRYHRSAEKRITLSEEGETLLKLWIEDLRSGKYPQTRGVLHRVKTEHTLNMHESFILTETPAGYCCLGVLSVRIEAEGATCEGWHFDGTDWKRGLSTNGGTIPGDIYNCTDLREVGYLEGILTDANDRDRLTFGEIANFLEAKFLGTLPPSQIFAVSEPEKPDELATLKAVLAEALEADKGEL